MSYRKSDRHMLMRVIRRLRAFMSCREIGAMLGLTQSAVSHYLGLYQVELTRDGRAITRRTRFHLSSMVLA